MQPLKHITEESKQTNVNRSVSLQVYFSIPNNRMEKLPTLLLQFFDF